MARRSRNAHGAWCSLAGVLLGVAILAIAMRSGGDDGSSSGTRPPDSSSNTIAPATTAQEHYMAGDYDGAQALAAAAIAATTQGSADSGSLSSIILAGTPDAANLPSLRVLSAVSAARGDVTLAVSLLQRCLDAGEALILYARTWSTEEELASLLENLRLDEEMVYSLALQRPEDMAVKKLALLFSLLRKGRSTEEIVRSYEVFRSAAKQSGSWDELRDARSRFALMSLLGQTNGDATLAWSRAQAIEKRLTESTGLAQYAQGALAMNTSPSLALSSLDVRLMGGAALVDYILFRRFDFGSTGRPPQGRGTLEYAALVVRDGGEIDIVPLGSAERVDRTVANFVRALSTPTSSPLTPAREAYNALFAPLRGKLRNPNSIYSLVYVYVSPDGELTRVPFDALHDGSAYLVDAYQITYAISGRDVSYGRLQKPSLMTISIFAAPDFSRSVPKGLHANYLSALPGALNEAADIHRIFPLASVSTGAHATRAALLATRRPGILHIATHGFFVDAPENDSDRFRGFSVKPVPVSNPVAMPAIRRVPLALSGLVLAGKDARGGVVTALDIVGMDLAGTQLAVLSACDTARATTRPGQGVHGLIRALFAAGAETVVASLWKIDDTTARTFMKQYYKSLSRAEGRVEALRSAARNVKASHPHPNFWAAFVVYGDHGPLRGAEGTAIGSLPPQRAGIEIIPMSTEPIIIGPH